MREQLKDAASFNHPLVIISSVIQFADRPLSYSAVRSVFSPEERESQTLNTIESVRNKVPAATIVLIEAGINEDFLHRLRKEVDQYIYVGDRFPVRYVANWRHKSLGEAMALYTGTAKIHSCEPDYYFKLSGRYFLNNNFHASVFGERGFTVKTYGEQISTRLYGFSPDQFHFWRTTLRASAKHLILGKSIEQVMYKKIKYRISFDLKEIGLSGLVAPDGNAIEE